LGVTTHNHRLVGTTHTCFKSSRKHEIVEVDRSH
jgi:hypothetical protein